MVKNYQLLIIVFSIFFSKNVFSIESALHEAELAKCMGVLMTIKNNDFEEKYKTIAKNTLDNYSDKISRISQGEMFKEMRDKGASIISKYYDQKQDNSIISVLNSCIMTFRVGK